MAQRQRSQINDLQAERSKLSAVLVQMTDGVLIVDDQGKVVLITGGARGITADVAVELAKKYQPTLVLVGENDKQFLAATDYMANKIPGAEKEIIPDAGHAANINQPEAFNRAVLKFLTEISL